MSVRSNHLKVLSIDCKTAMSVDLVQGSSLVHYDSMRGFPSTSSICVYLGVTLSLK